MLLKLILMTLLSALFAATALKISPEADDIWKYQRYNLVVDFDNRLPVCAPFSIFYYFYRIVKWIYNLICRFRRRTIFVIVSSYVLINLIILWFLFTFRKIILNRNNTIQY